MIQSSFRPVEVTTELVEAVRTFAPMREVEHCGVPFAVSAFDLYGTCPRCSTRLKLRGFSASPDLFDGFLEWLNHAENAEAADRRRRELQDDRD